MTPQTDAGRALLERIQQESPTPGLTPIRARDAILAIEAEARAALLADLRAKVEALPIGVNDNALAALEPFATLDRAAVLRLIDEAGRDKAPSDAPEKA